MDVADCEKKRRGAEQEILDILRNLEEETGMAIGAIDHVSCEGIVIPHRVVSLSITLSL